jgi:hypothetical protein
MQGKDLFQRLVAWTLENVELTEDLERVRATFDLTPMHGQEEADQKRWHPRAPAHMTDPEQRKDYQCKHRVDHNYKCTSSRSLCLDIHGLLNATSEHGWKRISDRPKSVRECAEAMDEAATRANASPSKAIIRKDRDETPEERATAVANETEALKDGKRARRTIGVIVGGDWLQDGTEVYVNLGRACSKEGSTIYDPQTPKTPKTRTKKVFSLNATFIAKETVRYCRHCKSAYGSEDLLRLVAGRCNVGWDVLVFVGRSLFQRQLTTELVVRELQNRHVSLSASEVGYLGRKFKGYR